MDWHEQMSVFISEIREKKKEKTVYSDKTKSLIIHEFVLDLAEYFNLETSLFRSKPPLYSYRIIVSVRSSVDRVV